jgi:hypothetical protein
MADLSVWPTDGADGSVSSEARWRKMGRLWTPSGVDGTPLGVGGGLGALAPTLLAGPAIQVAAGSCWLDGHYAELLAPVTIPASASGLLVVRFTPADNHAELVYRDAATMPPTQTVATWELAIASMAAGVLTDQRRYVMLGGTSLVPTCILRTTAAFTVPQGTATVAYGAGTELVDTHAMHDTVTNNGSIFAPVRGIYLLQAYAVWSGTDNGNYRITGIVNSAGAYIAQQQGPIYGGGSLTCSAHQLLNAGDYVRQNVVRDGTAAITCTVAQLSLALVAPAP